MTRPSCPPNKERIAKPLTFLVGTVEEPETVITPTRWVYEDDDMGWPTAQRAMQDAHMVEMRKPIWDAASIKECIMLCKAKKMYQGAIVVQRPFPGAPQEWKVVSPYQWGMVMEVHHYIPGQDTSNWHPLKVRWFCPQYHQGVAEEDFFPGELYLIQERIPEEEINRRIEEQKNAV